MNKAGLYLHVPFCQSKCGYCDFYSAFAPKEAKATYADALVRALATYQGVRADSVYFGGGTPSLLENAQLAAILRAVFAYHNIEAEAEITLEANPGTLDAARCEGLLQMGFNRLSFGMQSAVGGELAALGRIHTHAETVRAVRGARAAGFANIALDLMLGIPGQTAETLRESLEALLALAPDHVSAYLLKCETGTPFAVRYPGGQGLPGEDAQAEFYLAVCDTLARNGYRQEEVSNFARPGKESVHNQKYWTLAPYLGLGPGAHSDFGGRRFFFPRDTAAFCRAAAENALAGLAVTEDEAPDRLEETVMLSLRTGRGLTEAALCAVSPHGRALFARAADALLPYVKRGMVRREEGALRLTPAGFLLAHPLIAEVLLAMET